MAVVQANPTGGGQEAGKPAQGNIETANVLKLTEMFAKCSSQGGWSGDAAVYLQAIRDKLEDPGMTVKAKMTYLNEESVAFSTDDKNSIVLVRENDIVDIQALVADAKFFSARDAFFTTFPNNKLVNIISCNRFMFNRPNQMASCITQSLIALKDEQIGAFNVNSFGDKYHINIDTDFSNVKQFFDTHSPSPVVSGDFGFIAQIVDKSDQRYGQYQTKTPMFGVTGYVEFIRHENSGIFTPMVHVTDILSVMASPKILALALPLIGSVFIDRNLWRQPFSSIGEKAGINIGNLIIDATHQQPYAVKTEADFRKMFREYIGPPILCMDIRTGAPSIPGLNKITRPSDHDLLIADIYTFLNMNPVASESIGQNIFKEIVGVYETSKSTKFSNLTDTRDITYLYAVAKAKWSPKLDHLLARTDADPVRRFEMIKDILGGGDITPIYSSITTMLHGQFMRNIAVAVASKINVIMPMTTDLPSIDLTNMIDKSYQPGVTLFGQTGPANLIGSSFLRY